VCFLRGEPSQFRIARQRQSADKENAMRTLLRGTRSALLGLAVMGALGFGASAALAEPLRLPECQDPYANTACSSDLGCQRWCDKNVGTGLVGSCNESTYCCYCIELA
jgi:hypothetical protein